VISHLLIFPYRVLSNEYIASLHTAWCLNMLGKLWYSWLHILAFNQNICDQICENRSYSLFKVLVLTFHNFETNWKIFLKLHQKTAVSKNYHIAGFSTRSNFLRNLQISLALQKISAGREIFLYFQVNKAFTVLPHKLGNRRNFCWRLFFHGRKNLDSQ